MKEVDLPRVKSSTTLETAVEIMRDRGRSGLITEQDEKPVVITAKELLQYVRTRKRRDVHIDEIQPADLTVEVPISTFQRLNDSASRHALQSALSSRGAAQAIISLTESSGRIVTADDALADFLSRVVLVCTCKQDDTHVWLHDDLVDGKCGIDGEPVDCR